MAGTTQQNITNNAAKIAAIAPNQNMYRVPGGETNSGAGPAGQPAPATPQVISWMGTIGHVPLGDGTAGQGSGSGAGTIASSEDD